MAESNDSKKGRIASFCKDLIEELKQTNENVIQEKFPDAMLVAIESDSSEIMRSVVDLENVFFCKPPKTIYS
eukprot:UN25151